MNAGATGVEKIALRAKDLPKQSEQPLCGRAVRAPALAGAMHCVNMSRYELKSF